MVTVEWHLFWLNTIQDLGKSIGLTFTRDFRMKVTDILSMFSICLPRERLNQQHVKKKIGNNQHEWVLLMSFHIKKMKTHRMWYSSIHNYIIDCNVCLRWQSKESYKVKVFITIREKKKVLNNNVLTSFFNSFYAESYKLRNCRFLMLTNQAQMGAKNLIYIWKTRGKYIKAYY